MTLKKGIYGSILKKNSAKKALFYNADSTII